MATIGEYLTALAVCRDNLAAYLTEKGVAATADEKLNVLVQKVRQIPQTGGSVNEFMLLDTSTSTSKSDTLTTYGSSVYIYESEDSVVLSLSDVVEKYGGVTAEGIVESALDKVHIIEDLDYDNLVISIYSKYI